LDVSKSLRQIPEAKKVFALLSLTILLAMSTPASGTLMSVWDFGPDSGNYTLVPQFEFVSGVPTLTAGGADYDLDGGNGVGFTDAAGNIHDIGQALHWSDVSKSGGNDAYIIITIDTTGWQNMAIRWDYMSDNTSTKRGPVRFDLDYAVGAGSWTNILDNEVITRDDAWHPFTYDLSSLTAINNQSSVQFRINDIKEDVQKDGDYWQDNIQLTGTPIPEPFSVILFALGGAALLRKRQR
jgi:hypothetical protein